MPESASKNKNKATQHTKPLSYRTRPVILVLLLLSVLLGSLLGFIYWSFSNLPAIMSLEAYSPAESSLVFSTDGKVLAELYLERRTFIPHYNIPDMVKKAFVAIEDARFYSHPGVDIIGILRALYQDIKTRSIAQGGSTITQQLAKMLFLKPERNIMRKLKEAAISIQIEKRYTKDEIIGLYLNQAYFGTRAYGIEAASQTYFGKSVNELSVGEAALLASLPKAPSVYSPFKNAGKARERRSIVLKQMLAQEFITQEQYEAAEREPVPAAPHFRKYEAPYFIEMLRHELEADYNSEVYKAGFRIYSSVDDQMQKTAEEAVRTGIAALQRRVGPGVQAALVAMEINTGNIRAMVGGTDFWENQFNRATQALRQPGSAFKPFVYLTAIENGMTAEDSILDAPISLKGARPGHPWIPKNYDGRYHGLVTLKTALAKSLNAATVRLAGSIGIDSIIDSARRLGIKSDMQPYLPLALGASDVTLMDMVSAYAVFATGYHVKPKLYNWVVSRKGIPLDEPKVERTEIVSQEDVEQMKKLLNAVVEQGTALRAKELKKTLYGKTGTTNDYTDAWFIGFDEQLVVGVWVGRDDHKPIGPKETGARAALPIWIDFMKKAPLQNPSNQNP
ncbi:MAG TPA: PBP1A family penicillin-binding protein [Thermodesulfovibrionales bacterium]|nr:PBP1A family penicillin-binding protein [Thermodesulfovibrionales bacterium]